VNKDHEENRPAGSASDADPNGQRVPAADADIDRLSGKCCTVLSIPVNLGVLANLEEKIQFFIESQSSRSKPKSGND
jgi:hypothetical protein